MKKQLSILLAILAVYIEALIWIYITYWLIKNSSPDRLIWFLFLAYIPVTIITSILSKVIINMGDD